MKVVSANAASPSGAGSAAGSSATTVGRARSSARTVMATSFAPLARYVGQLLQGDRVAAPGVLIYEQCRTLLLAHESLPRVSFRGCTSKYDIVARYAGAGW